MTSKAARTRCYMVIEKSLIELSDLDRLYDTVKKHNRKVDIILANAGLAKLAPFGTVDEGFFDLHFNANVKGLFFSVEKGLPLMKDGGSIILNGSIADIKGFPAMSVYSATKAAVRSFARTWTIDLRDRCIRVNVLSPGHIDTPIMESLQQGEALLQMKKEMENNVRSAGWETRTRSLKLFHSSRPTKPAMSRAQSFAWMAASPKSEAAKCAISQSRND